MVQFLFIPQLMQVLKKGYCGLTQKYEQNWKVYVKPPATKPIVEKVVLVTNEYENVTFCVVRVAGWAEVSAGAAVSLNVLLRSNSK